MSVIRFAIPLLLIALIIAFWFSSMAQHYNKDAISKIKENFIKEREKFRVDAEKDKRRVEKEAQKNIVREATTTHAKANFKVGLAVAGVFGVGALFVFAQMVTVGLLAISATGGAIGGYYWRGKRLRNGDNLLPNSSANLKEISTHSNLQIDLKR
jgi:hypothetical protein